MKKLFHNMITHLFYRMKHSNITYNPITRVTLIDNSLIKALEIAQARKKRILKNNENKALDTETETQNTIEMSESHECKPFFKKIK